LNEGGGNLFSLTDSLPANRRWNGKRDKEFPGGETMKGVWQKGIGNISSTKHRRKVEKINSNSRKADVDFRGPKSSSGPYKK
jgi:hypothetical protein